MACMVPVPLEQCTKDEEAENEEPAAASAVELSTSGPDCLETLVMPLEDLDDMADNAKNALQGEGGQNEDETMNDADPPNLETPLKRLHNLPTKPSADSVAESPGCDKGGCYKAGPQCQLNRLL